MHLTSTIRGYFRHTRSVWDFVACHPAIAGVGQGAAASKVVYSDLELKEMPAKLKIWFSVFLCWVALRIQLLCRGPG